MSVIGIDFGNSNSRVASAGKGGVDVLLNGISKRDNASLVSFGAKERHIGESGMDQMVRNAANTVTSVKRFIGMHYNAPALEAEKSHATCEIKRAKDDSSEIEFAVQYNEELHMFRPEQILAMILTELKSIASIQKTSQGSQGGQHSCVLSCPAYYTQNQKNALLNACEIADISCLALLNETTAAALDYGIFKSAEFPLSDSSKGNGVNVCFIDVGHSATTASVVSFYATEMKVIATCCDENLGTRNLDMILLHHFREEISKKYRFDVFNSKKAKTRLLQSCQKIKTTLSANPVTSLSLECLYEDMDIHFPSFTREEFEGRIADFSQQYEALCQRVVALARSHSGAESDISNLSVELIGGGSRIPTVKRITQSVFGSSPRSTLNATETVSKGCAIYAAMLSPNYRVREYKISDVAMFPTKIGYFSPISSAPNPQRELYPFLPEDINKIVNIIKVGDSIPKVLDVTFERDESFEVYTFYEKSMEAINIDRVMPGQHLLDHSTVTNVTSDIALSEQVIAKQNKVKLRFKASIAGIIDIASAQVITEYDQWESISEASSPASPEPSSEAAENPSQADVPMTDQEVQQEKRLKKERKTSQALIQKHSLEDGMSADMVLKSKRAEKEMCIRDIVVLKTAETRNSLETCFYEYRYKIVDQDGELHRFVPPADIGKFDQLCSENRAWLESDEGYDADMHAYSARLAPMESIVDGAVKRFRNLQDIPLSAQEFEKKIMDHRAQAHTLKSDAEGGWHTEADLKKIQSSLDDVEGWYEKTQQEAQKQPLFTDPVLTKEALQKKLKETEGAILALLNKPKPAPAKTNPNAKPKEEEQKKDETTGDNKASQGPADMDVE